MEVLILVLVEDGLWHQFYWGSRERLPCLNPCFSGRWSLTPCQRRNHHSRKRCLNPCFSGRWSLTNLLISGSLWWIPRLNPCFNGRWSLTAAELAEAFANIGLNPCFNGRWSLTFTVTETTVVTTDGLNPCFNGRWSLTFRTKEAAIRFLGVLILVLMEDGLWQVVKCMMETELWSLNPCFNGRWSLTVKLAENLKEPNLS